MADQTKCWTVLSLINWTNEYFAKAGLDNPRLATEILLAHVLGCERIELYTRFDSTPTEPQRTQFRSLVLRAVAHEPIAYLVGKKEFYSLELKVTPDVLIPRPETEIIVDQTLKCLAALDRPGFVWDVGTGSGCAAIAVAANNPDVLVLATDISAEAVAVAAENAETHNVADRVFCRQADLLDLPIDWPGTGQFDVITANLPYVGTEEEVAAEVEHEPSVALYGGKSGLEFLDRITNDAPLFMAVGSTLILEFGLYQADDVRDLIVEAGFEEPILIHDIQDLERTAVAVWMG